MIVRILLLLLPIVVAAILYVEGQKYDPSLIDFTSAPTSSPTSLLPDSAAGYGRIGVPRLFTEKNLYEYVDGHAEYYISAGFIGLGVGEYARSGADGQSPEIVVEIFDLGSGMQAFGVLADEAGENPLESSVGAFSLRSSRGLRFIAGRYYVRINAFSDGLPFLEFAGRIAEGIGGSGDFASVFSRFPDLGQPVATRFIREAYRGIDFMNGVIEREYYVDGDPVYLFLAPGDADEIENLTGSFFDFFERSGIEYRTIENAGRTYYQVLDPYEGDWYLIPGDEELFGLYGARESGVVSQVLDRLGGGVSKTNSERAPLGLPRGDSIKVDDPTTGMQ